MTSIAFFTRLLDAAAPAERYRLALQQLAHAELHGFSRAWVAQHHFHEAEGGLPAPLVFLAHAAAHTTHIRLGTGVITLPLEQPVRVAEDAAVTDLLSDGRLDLGFGNGGTPDSFATFGLTPADKAERYRENLDVVLRALRGDPLPHSEQRIYPANPELAARVWQATFSIDGGARAGRAGHGLLLSRTQPRDHPRPHTPLHDIQEPIVEAYLRAFPTNATPRITASRTVFVADDRTEAMRFAGAGLRRIGAAFGLPATTPLAELITRTDTHVGTVAEVTASLAADPTLRYADEIAIQVHSVDAPHAHVLRSLELFAHHVAPHFGWGTHDTAAPVPGAAPAPDPNPNPDLTATGAALPGRSPAPIGAPR